MSKKTIIICSMIFMLTAGYVLHITAEDYVFLNFNSRDRVTQPAPTGHKPGKDNGAEIGGFHMAGEDCGICHTPNGKAGNYLFTMSGTLYEDKTATTPLADGEVMLQDKDGNVISMISNEVGNFWTYAPIASHPYAVSASGTVTKLYTENPDGSITPANPNDSRTWLYKTWVKNGDLVVYMATIGPVGGGSGTTPRMGCGMHHGSMSSRGALWASRKGTLSSYPESGLGFKKHILPILMSKCASCHRPGETWTRIVMKSDLDAPSSMIDYSKAHDLTAYNDQTVTVSGTAWAKYGTGHYAKGYSANPDISPLLLRTVIGGQNHGGGHYWTKDDADYKAIRQWIVEGAQNN